MEDNAAPSCRAEFMKKLLAWLQASRLMSQPYILLPLLFGQGLYVRHTGVWSIDLFMIGCCYSLLLQLYIVYANDYADEAVDKANTTFNVFSGGSRVLVEKKLTPQELRWGILWILVLSMMLALVTGVVYARVGIIFFLLFSWGLLWAYSYPPFQLSYRGGGEWLQAIGVGIVLPLTGYYFQAGSLKVFPWVLLPFTVLLHFGAALVTTLPDEPSDRSGHKRTLAVRKGQIRVIRWIILLYGMSFFMVFVWILVFARLPRVFALSIFPALLAYMGLCWIRSEPVPGLQAMNWFVGLGVATVVLLMAGLCIMLWFFSG